MMTGRLFTVAVTGLALVACGPRGKRPAPEPQPTGPELDDFMRRELNVRFTRVSYLLFHEGGDDNGDALPDRLPDAMVTEVAALQQVAAILRRWPDPPAESHRQRILFHEQASLLESALAGLHNAAGANNRQEAAHWFSHVKATCEHCHDMFRFRRIPLE